MEIRPYIKVFGNAPQNAILVPNYPITVFANCRTGNWEIGYKNYGRNCKMCILKFAKFLNPNVNKYDPDKIKGQIWFVTEGGDLPRGVLLVTYIKGRSLNSFEGLITELQCERLEPAEKVIVGTFTKRYGRKADERGIMQPNIYWSLQWHSERRQNRELLTEISKILYNRQIKLIDEEYTSELISLSDATPEEIGNLLNPDGALNGAITPEVVD